MNYIFTVILALVWQLMRAYTLTILAQCVQGSDTVSLATDKEIIAWVNEKLEKNGKSGRIRSFQDSTISDGKIIIDLVDGIKPGTIDYDLVKSDLSPEVFFI